MIPCVADCGPTDAPDPAPPFPALHDPEGERLAHDLPPVVDAHVHLFDDATFAKIWHWFEHHGWPIRYPLRSPRVLQFLKERGLSRIVGLCYSHRPGLSRPMNRYMAELQASDPGFLVGLGTVLPGEEGAGDIVREAFAMGLRGIKLHCHVQGFSPDDPRLAPIWEACVEADKPVVMHAGREPRAEGYRFDSYQLCRVDRTEAVLREYPRLRLVVPHMGIDELDGYARLLERYENLWLDTTMVLARYFPFDVPESMLRIRPDRILYGSDFPNLPYAWDREIRGIARMKLGDDALAAMVGGNASRLYGL